MREVELKAVVDDVAARRARVEAAGGQLVFAGRLEDRRYDTPDRRLVREDLVLRLRTYRSADGGVDGVRAHLDWKGPTARVNGFKVRDELSTTVGDPETLAVMLDRLGYTIVREIDREIVQYAWREAMVRFEHYPRMDALLEVEGDPATIDAAIAMLGMPRSAFSADRLPDFVARYEARTGMRAALCDRELTDGWQDERGEG